MPERLTPEQKEHIRTTIRIFKERQNFKELKKIAPNHPEDDGEFRWVEKSLEHLQKSHLRTYARLVIEDLTRLDQAPIFEGGKESLKLLQADLLNILNMPTGEPLELTFAPKKVRNIKVFAQQFLLYIESVNLYYIFSMTDCTLKGYRPDLIEVEKDTSELYRPLIINKEKG